MPIDISACLAALEGIEAKVLNSRDQVAQDGAEGLRTVAQGLAPKLSGQLAGSILVTFDGVGSRLIGPTVVYGRIRELGGRIPQHPMSHPFLRWWVGGRPVFARRVHQSGTHYMHRALETYTPRYQEVAYRDWADAWAA